MRWEGLFEDLESQWFAEERRERDAEVADRTRAERARIALAERYAASRDTSLTLTMITGEVLGGDLVDLGADWLLMQDRAGRDVLVAMDAVVAVAGLGRGSDPATTARRFAIGYALRGLARDRATVIVVDVAGNRVTGTIDAVGKDWCELSEHPVDEPRRAGQVRARRVIPVGAIVLVRNAARNAVVLA